ncbi:DUF1700 domain-containing protein [Herbinix luporum]|jgi:uncharacterized membrane protein|uniref:Putative membrane protein n=1 Tax=Herbinix luporum TaxID=1679721 RepID=A0A0K8J8Q5_9FIRM|nr:hypothetical protein [Herbinix luporum]CUH93682.1 putative membrane protein [Herbinix luporum]HHT56949.1 DUF1700 domain-containing protein [Herbinix luporum]
MNKKEFLDILRQSLEGEIDNRVIEQSIRFYSEYISSQEDKSEEEVIKEIGDPRLIAKTIIESEKNSTNNYSNYNSNRYDSNYSRYENDTNRNIKYYHLKWYHKALGIFILFMLLFFIIRIGWIMIRMLFLFLPLLIIIAVLWAIFKKQ